MSAGKTRRLLFVNAILLIGVLSVLYIKFNKKNTIVDVERGHSPNGLYKVLEEKNLEFVHKLQAFFIFNTRPTLSSLEDIDKLYHVYRKDGVDFYAIFSSPFRLPSDFHLPHQFSVRYKFFYNDLLGRRNDPSQFIIIDDRNVVFADRVLGFPQLVKALERQVHPSADDPIQLSGEDLRALLLERMRGRDIGFLDVYTREERSLKSILAAGIDELYVIHAACMGCELTRLLSNIAELRNRKTAIVLSVHANSYEIKALLALHRIRPAAFVDSLDGLGMLHASTNEENALSIFSRKEFLN